MVRALLRSAATIAALVGSATVAVGSSGRTARTPAVGLHGLPVSKCTDSSGHNPGPCKPGREQCGPPFSKTLNPSYHLMDQQGCGENDPNSPVFDPVHGVIHHFYQAHVTTPEGGGPNYGHFVSVSDREGHAAGRSSLQR